ncbi:hypothetical protein [Profundibacter sp.]|uniref:hypothetical protein n=1 Tax=Profundibacter sp. TaxID=3101071 RepID=UPI003D10DD94
MSGKRIYPAIGIALLAVLIAGYEFLTRSVPIPDTVVSSRPVAVEPVVTKPKPIPHDIARLALPAVGQALARRVGQSEQSYKPLKPDNAQYSLLGFSCRVSLDVAHLRGDLVTLELDAPCQMGVPVIVRHEGVSFTAVTSDIGRVTVKMPVFNGQAVFSVEMPDGSTISTEALVQEANDYDHVAVMWSGDTGLQIHAYEPFGAHVWSNAPQNISIAIKGRGGYVTRLGSTDFPVAMRAEVYSFPRRQIRKTGVVRLDLSAAITPQTCGKNLLAKTLQPGVNGGNTLVDLVLNMPACDSGVRNLVLKNIFRDLKIAQN